MSSPELRKPVPAEEELMDRIVGAAAEVHRVLGPGLLESAYENCFGQELALRQLNFQRQRPLPVEYKGTTMNCGYTINFLVEDQVIVELKAVDLEIRVSEAQARTYMKFAEKRLGLILNFSVPSFKDGIRRIVV